MKILVALASFGTTNDLHLKRVLDEYRKMPFEVHVVVLSNIPKQCGPGVEVIVGLPSKNPFTLPFAHKKVFGNRVEEHDLFIYSEDDILISQRNIEAFLKITPDLAENELAGFLLAERSPEGSLFYCVLHGFFHWEPDSVRERGEYKLARCNNEHSACFLLTQAQLRRAIASGGFLVEPHDGRYQLRETAATDPYTQCGFQKVVPVSHLEDFTVFHLPNNRYSTAPWEIHSVLEQQVQALLDLQKNGRPHTLLLNPETKVPHRTWSKNYYERCRTDMISLIPSAARSVLSLGCGFGYTEEQLIKQGMSVVGIPLDSVIAACAESKGVEIVYGDFPTAENQLGDRRFDCILASDILHLVADPVSTLRSLGPFLSPQGVLIAGTPNFSYLPITWRRIGGHPHLRGLGNYDEVGFHCTTGRLIREWFDRANLRLERIVWPEPAPDFYPPQLGPVQRRWRRIRERFWGAAKPLLASELIAVGKKGCHRR